MNNILFIGSHMRKKAKADCNPEAYKDEGCRLFPSCLKCPLPVCVYEDSRAIKRMRDQEILKRYREGYSPRELAQMFGITIRTIYRALAV